MDPDQYMTVYRQNGVLHFPGDEEGQTACEQDTEGLTEESRPVWWAGMWCSACMRKKRGLVSQPSR